jgi:hypothetical protein
MPKNHPDNAHDADRPAGGRAERLAAALRANLRRRKQQARAREGSERCADEPAPEKSSR